MTRKSTIAAVAALSMYATGSAQNFAQNQNANHDLGFKDTPMLPGLPYHVHDSDRPHPPVVTPAAQLGGAPSDAIVLFDGKDLAHWTAHRSSITRAGSSGEPERKLDNDYVEVVPNTGDIATKEKFGDWQLLVHQASPPEI